MLRRFPAFKTLLLSSSIAALTACGGGAGSSTSTGGSPQSAQSGEPVVMQGQFLDSAVEGLWYETATQSGFTDWYGGFSYVPGESVRFYLGTTLLGEALAQEEVTPLDLVTALDHPDKLQNMLRALQTLDADSDASNGIQINNIAQDYLDQYVLPINQPAVLFEASNVIQEMITAVTNGTGLKGAVDSFIHFRETLLLSRRNVDDTILLNLLGTTWDAEITSTACPDDISSKLVYRFNPLGTTTSGYHRLTVTEDADTGAASCKKAGNGILFNTYETDPLFGCANQCVDADLNRVIMETDDHGDVITALNYDTLSNQITVRITRMVGDENVTTTRVLTRR